MEEHARQTALPGSAGEHALQQALGNEDRAHGFYDHQMLDFLNPDMMEFISRQSMMFVASSDSHGECDCTFRAGPVGFVRTIGEKHLLWPEYRGNGVTASGGNVQENPRIGLLFIDFVPHTIGLHVNGKAELRRDGDFEGLPEGIRDAVSQENSAPGVKKPAFWFLLEVEEAYAHCAKHIPRFIPCEKELDWGTDDTNKKGGDFFRVKAMKKEARKSG